MMHIWTPNLPYVYVWTSEGAEILEMSYQIL